MTMLRKLNRQIRLLTAIICCAAGVQAQQPAVKVKTLGEPAPSLYISNWIKGDKVTAFEKGKVYVVEFWATWCKPCIAGMPHLSELAEKYKKDVTVLGVSIHERKETTLPVIEKFVAGMGDKMKYNVATEQNNLMAENWMKAYGERGIPYSFVVDQQGRVAWAGAPKNLDKVLPQVVAGTWDVKEAAEKRKEWQRLSVIDNNSIPVMNTFMGNPGNPTGALKKIDSILAENPGLKYYPKVGHFTFYALLKTDPEKAVEFGKEWLKHNDYPPFSTVTDAVTGKKNLPASAYVLAAGCYQAQLDLYPWSMDFPATYKKMAELYTQAGDKSKAAEMLKKADSAVAEKTTH
ncbi:TlpA family protein disulfide reductase [Chitinophaga sp.]|uniref:TlpA family protein disulfide reductase n=1 Tax=Chitinophaga sp. TaxID=1869181 RepID=UPI002BA2B2BF|nr:redoxin domain-containing protein [Chitinophaga sp.]HWV67216.1 redoxin domain-containing protein [Chitinophaga sp.]